MSLIATFYSRYSLDTDSRNKEGRGEGQGITLIGARLCGQKSHEGIKIYSAAEAQLNSGVMV